MFPHKHLHDQDDLAEVDQALYSMAHTLQHQPQNTWRTNPSVETCDALQQQVVGHLSDTPNEENMASTTNLQHEMATQRTPEVRHTISQKTGNLERHSQRSTGFYYPDTPDSSSTSEDFFTQQMPIGTNSQDPEDDETDNFTFVHQSPPRPDAPGGPSSQVASDASSRFNEQRNSPQQRHSPLAGLYMELQDTCTKAARYYYLQHVDSPFAPRPLDHETSTFASYNKIFAARRHELGLVDYVTLLSDLQWSRTRGNGNVGWMDTVHRMSNLCGWGARVVNSVRGAMDEEAMEIEMGMDTEKFRVELYGGEKVLVDLNTAEVCRAAQNILGWVLCEEGALRVCQLFDVWWESSQAIGAWIQDVEPEEVNS
ncbi:MAG: hypothetical protein MMC23_008236 [Stictis urceolatum]|nr:hypothetical protein [Stictis urceolata]